MFFIFTLLSCNLVETFGVAEKERSGKEVYQTFCVHCHQANGQGVATRYPPLDQSQWLKGDLPVKIILHGLKGPIEVAGQNYNNVMAPWGRVLTDHEIAGVVNYLRSSWGNDSLYASEPPLKKSDVKKIREQFIGASNWTAEQLKNSQ
tara:strand:- start:21 stop:464 length:444 start_codon:yes stop_codon:yes gene_type:complete